MLVPYMGCYIMALGYNDTWPWPLWGYGSSCCFANLDPEFQSPPNKQLFECDGVNAARSRLPTCTTSLNSLGPAGQVLPLPRRATLNGFWDQGPQILDSWTL